MTATTEMTDVVQQLLRIEDHLRLHPIGSSEADNAEAIDALVVARAVIGRLNVIADSQPGDLETADEPTA